MRYKVVNAAQSNVLTALCRFVQTRLGLFIYLSVPCLSDITSDCTKFLMLEALFFCAIMEI